MHPSQESNFEYPRVPRIPRIKWSWLILSGVSLLSGFFYLATMDITAPIQLTENTTEQR